MIRGFLLNVSGEFLRVIWGGFGILLSSVWCEDCDIGFGGGDGQPPLGCPLHDTLIVVIKGSYFCKIQYIRSKLSVHYLFFNDIEKYR